ncbi:MAG: hypothetical protein ACKVOB_05425 [Sphingomonas sp.]
MLTLILAAVAQVATASEVPAGRPEAAAQTPAQIYEQCVDLATGDPAQGEAFAEKWRVAGGAFLARQCLGIAYANQARWVPAASQFETAANQAETAHDERAARYWAQAGNAWLAAGQAASARAALNAALAAGTLQGLELGEAQFDRARALVGLNDLAAARVDMDLALRFAEKDPLVWLASAALARRMGNLAAARHDAAKAYDLAADDPSVFLEIGNIAAASGDDAGARSAWNDVVRVAPKSAAATQARTALQQFDPPEKPAADR